MEFKKNIYFCSVPDLRYIYSCLVSVLFISSFTFVKAQVLEFERLNIGHGLPSDEVYNIYEDKKGYIWACTEYGIAKHNGTRFIQVCKNIPFEKSAFYVIKESPKGELFLANSWAQIYKVRNDSAFLLQGMEKTSEEIVSGKEVIFDMLIDEHSNIYFSTLSASYLLSGNRVISLSRQYANDSGNIYFKKAGMEYALIKTGKNLFRNYACNIIDERGKLIHRIPSTNYGAVRNRLGWYGGSYYYYANNNELTVMHRNGDMRTITLKEHIINMEWSPDSTVWIGTDNGLYQLDVNLNTLAYYFKGCVVSDITFDHRNGVWVSTIERGVYYCRNRNNIYYRNIPDLASKISLLKVIDNRFFIGTSNGNLFEMENNRLVKKDLRNNTFYLTDIAYFDNAFVLGTKNMTIFLDDEARLRQQKYLFAGPGKKLAASYGFAQEHDALIFICPTGIFRYKDNRSDMLAEIKDKPRCITQRSNGEYLIGTSHGIILLNDVKCYRPDYLSRLNNKVVLNLLADKDSNVWICTKGYGLYKLLPDNRLVEFPKIPSHVVNHIHILHDTVILLSTDKGLFINKIRTIDRNGSWKLLVNNEVMEAELFGGHIFIATKQGLMTIRKDKALAFAGPAPRFYLESITTSNRKVDFKDMQLSYQENSIYFNFDILAYETPAYTLSYELEGPDQLEGITDGKQVYLHKLQPGEYVLSVRPFYSGIYNQQSVIRIPFYIRPAFWQTKTFLISFSIIFIVMTVLVLRNLKMKEKRKANTARLLAEYRLTALKAQINPHFISNSLTAIQQLMIRNDIDKACQYIAKFSMFLRYVLKYSDKYVTYLADEINLIRANIELEQLRFNNKFIFEQDISKGISLNEICVPPLITQPIIENAIWHGLLPLKDKRTPKLTLKAEIIHEKLVISIIDNGIGRSRSQMRLQNTGTKESRGTWLVRNWMENLNQFLTVKGAAVNYIDLYDEQNNPAGTKVDIIFPIEALNRLRYEKNTFSDY
mgnify:FL=1